MDNCGTTAFATAAKACASTVDNRCISPVDGGGSGWTDGLLRVLRLAVAERPILFFHLDEIDENVFAAHTQALMQPSATAL